MYTNNQGSTTNISSSYTPISNEEDKNLAKLDELKNSNKFINSILQNLNSALFVVDSEARLIGFNDNNHLLFTRAEHEIIGHIFGNTCGCAYAEKYNSLCGTTPKCGSCNIRKTIVSCFKTKEPRKNVPIRHTFINDDEENNKELMFSTKYISFKGQDMVLIIVDDITELENQKKEIIKSKNEIIGSIEYAKRIQQAVLTSKRKLDEILGNHFLLYRPRDIVSGDFYFATNVGDWKIALVADCTGHGVPGAFMSLLSITYLREIIEKDKITRPDIILNELRKSIMNALYRRNNNLVLMNLDESSLDDVIESLSDGLDASICSLNTKTRELLFAGANNSLYRVRNKKLEEIKGDRMPVGYYLKMDKFSFHRISLKKGDKVYMSSDGFPDQFGGSEGKKLKHKRFKEMLLEMSPLPMKDQGIKLLEAYESWKGNNDQIDDVCVIGIEAQ
jgi:serine phosphatase RsbU (regulator of sigma subunit)